MNTNFLNRKQYDMIAPENGWITLSKKDLEKYEEYIRNLKIENMTTIIKTSITFLKTEDGFRATSGITGEVFGIGETENEAKNNLFNEFNKLSDEHSVGELFKHPYNCKVILKKFTLTEV